jgi:chemosensory pili system protein ChpA (sensor histidine kinase/response regulator)
MSPIILTVDDAKAVRSLVEKALTPYVCEPTEASNGFNGFYAIQNKFPDLVILDVMMPVMGGIEMLERIRRTPELQHIPVIMMPSRSDHQYMDEIKSFGPQGILMKPFTEAALLEAIQRVVKLKPKKGA